VGGNVFSDQRKSVTFGFFNFYNNDAAGGWSYQFSPNLSWQPSSAVAIRLGPSYTMGRSAAQFLDAVPDTVATTFGARYLFGRLYQHQLDLTARLSWTFSPDLSFQLYLQPFVFTADYSELKELRAPRTFDFNVFGRDNNSTVAYDSASNSYLVDPDGPGPANAIGFGNPDFRIRSLQSNAVLRWEYRPGSTLYLVWTQSRFGSFEEPAVRFGGDLRGLMRDRPNNVLLVKLNYWLSL
jgi:hypothetical protein